MPIFEITSDALVRLETTTFAEKGLGERQDLQRLLRSHIHIIAPDLYVLAEEYSEWEDARRSIDLLCLDKHANVVVLELKRTDDGGHMELQAVRYAAMVSKLTFADAVQTHSKYLRKIGSEDEAEGAILRFLDWDEPLADEFAQKVRIILVSANFSKEITTTVIWLSTEYGVDIRCVRLQPYTLDARTLLDVQQVLPLPEAAEYQVQFRRKAAEERQAQERGPDWSKYDVKLGNEVVANLTKRGLFLTVVRGLLQRGVTIPDIMHHLPERKFLRMKNPLEASQFRANLIDLKRPRGGSYDPRRFFLEDDELIHFDGATWALSNQWSITSLPNLDALLTAHPKAGIQYEKRSDDVAGV